MEYSGYEEMTDAPSYLVLEKYLQVYPSCEYVSRIKHILKHKNKRQYPYDLGRHLAWTTGESLWTDSITVSFKYDQARTTMEQFLAYDEMFYSKLMQINYSRNLRKEKCGRKYFKNKFTERKVKHS